MILDAILVLLSLIFILLTCALFVNGIEWLGKKLDMNQGVIGSIFAAVGTALPETVIPIIAILFYKGPKAGEIGIGAIAGAPFMLGTLAFFVTGTAVIIYSLLGKRSIKMNVDLRVFSRDLSFFIAIYGIAVLTTFIRQYTALRILIALMLLVSYAFYVKRTLNDECEQCSNLEPLYISRYFKLKTSLLWIYVQLALALIGIVYGAHIFVQYVEKLSTFLGVAPLILSIIITPIATELPEKFNSVMWIGKKKDTLALGNIVGAMVFQGCFPVVFGMIFTPWDLTGVTMVSAVLAFSSAVLNLLWVKIKKSVNAFALLSGGVLYSIFLVYIFA